ncbi:hypothetical protein [Streptomyces sp. NPDC054784]
MPAFLIRYPKGHGEDILAQDDALTLTLDHGWAILADGHGPCIAVPADSGATITRIDPEEPAPKE